jgi:hypothetical protein
MKIFSDKDNKLTEQAAKKRKILHNTLWLWRCGSSSKAHAFVSAKARSSNRAFARLKMS